MTAKSSKPAPGHAEPCVAGAIVLENRRALQEIVGADPIEKGLDRVARDVKEEYEGALPVSWVRITTVVEVFEAVARETGRDMPRLHLEVARIGVERAIRTFWRLLLRFTTDEWLMSRTPAIYARAYNRGRLETNITEPGQAIVRLLDWPDAPEWPIRGTTVGIDAVLRIAGRKDVKVAVERSADGAVYRATWKP
jgi:hypothetical protein